ncbi:MAG: TRAP transporter small permease subunit [Rhodopseudomonas sp.]|nr:TRAP transporter small permease subunit [Rhodopseudomonas sp.]
MTDRHPYWQRLLRITQGMALVGFFGLLILAVMTTLDVLSRWLFSAPIYGVNDVSAIVMAVVIAACLPANLAARQNITVDFLGNLLGWRAKAFFDGLGGLVTLLFIGLVAWQFVPYTIEVTRSGQTTWVLKLPIAPGWWIATAFLLMSVPVQLTVAVFDLSRAFGRRPDGDI